MTLIQETLDQRYTDAGSGADFSEAGSGLLAASSLIDGERNLKAMFSDPALSGEGKTEVVAKLFTGKITAIAQAVLVQVVTSRWNSDADLVDAVEQSGVILVLMGAEKDGESDRVEEELFRFGRAIDANADLQMALTDPASTPEVKSGIVDSLLAGKSADQTIVLISHTAGSLRGRRIQDAISGLSELAASRRGRVVAQIRVATELNDDQKTRLAEALAKLHGREVELNVTVDPSVIGGIEVTIGDEVIDGTASTKLEQARRKMAG